MSCILLHGHAIVFFYQPWVSCFHTWLREKPTQIIFFLHKFMLNLPLCNDVQIIREDDFYFAWVLIDWLEFKHCVRSWRIISLPGVSQNLHRNQFVIFNLIINQSSIILYQWYVDYKMTIDNLILYVPWMPFYPWFTDSIFYFYLFWNTTEFVSKWKTFVVKRHFLKLVFFLVIWSHIIWPTQWI